MCSSCTPSWSATEAMHRRSHWEFLKLGVTMENCISALCSIEPPRCEKNLAKAMRFSEEKRFQDSNPRSRRPVLRAVLRRVDVRRRKTSKEAVRPPRYLGGYCFNFAMRV